MGNLPERLIIQIMLEKSFAPPVWMSANLEGGDEFNLKYISRYKSRAKHLG